MDSKILWKSWKWRCQINDHRRHRTRCRQKMYTKERESRHRYERSTYGRVQSNEEGCHKATCPSGNFSEISVSWPRNLDVQNPSSGKQHRLNSSLIIRTGKVSLQASHEGFVFKPWKNKRRPYLRKIDFLFLFDCPQGHHHNTPGRATFTSFISLPVETSMGRLQPICLLAHTYFCPSYR